MKLLLPILVAVGGILFLKWVRAGHDRGGEVGRKIRWSDWMAWKYAVDEMEAKLSELKKAEPKR